MTVVNWKCSVCERTWEILCDLPLQSGPTFLPLGQYDFRCPNGCKSYRDDSPKEFDNTTIPEGLPGRPLKYREKGTAEWRAIS